MRRILTAAWTFGRSAYDLRAPLGQALIGAGGTMLAYDYKKELAIPLLVVGTFLAGQGKPTIPTKVYHDPEA